MSYLFETTYQATQNVYKAADYLKSTKALTVKDTDNVAQRSLKNFGRFAVSTLAAAAPTALCAAQCVFTAGIITVAGAFFTSFAAVPVAIFGSIGAATALATHGAGLVRALRDHLPLLDRALTKIAGPKKPVQLGFFGENKKTLSIQKLNDRFAGWQKRTGEKLAAKWGPKLRRAADIAGYDIAVGLSPRKIVRSFLKAAIVGGIVGLFGVAIVPVVAGVFTGLCIGSLLKADKKRLDDEAAATLREKEAREKHQAEVERLTAQYKTNGSDLSVKQQFTAATDQPAAPQGKPPTAPSPSGAPRM